MTEHEHIGDELENPFIPMNFLKQSFALAAFAMTPDKLLRVV